MIIPIRLKEGADGVEFAIVELQGVLETPSSSRPHGLTIGDLTFDATGAPTLVIGNHKLRGKLEKLQAPLAVFRRVGPPRRPAGGKGGDKDASGGTAASSAASGSAGGAGAGAGAGAGSGDSGGGGGSGSGSGRGSGSGGAGGRSSGSAGDDGDGDVLMVGEDGEPASTEYVVEGFIKTRIHFKERPRPIVRALKRQRT